MKTKVMEAEMKRNKEMHHQQMKHFRLEEAKLKKDLGMLVENPPLVAKTGDIKTRKIIVSVPLSI